jgi:hypothetical protein
MILWSAATQGPAALPGTYHVRLTANGVTQTQDLEVKKDPRVDVSIEDLQKQFDLASKITAQMTQANTIVSEIRNIRKQEEDALKSAADLKPMADALNAKMKTIEETVYQTQNRSGQDPLNFPIRLNNYIGALGRVVMSGDAAPTAQSYTVEEELAGRLATEQKTFDAVVADELAKLNAALAKKQHKPIAVAILPEP